MRLENAAAVREEHGHPDAKALRDEADLQHLIFQSLLLRSLDVGTTRRSKPRRNARDV